MKKLFLSLIIIFGLVGIVQADSAPCVEQGGTIDLYVQFLDSTGAPSAATSKEALIVDSAQSTDTAIADGSFVQVASKTGWYTVPLTVGAADPVGSWTVHWEGTVGGVALAGIDYIEVRESGGKCGITTTEVNTEADTALTDYAPAVAGDSMTLTAAAIDLIFAEGVEGIYSFRDVLCIMAGVITAKLSSSGGVATFRGLEDTEDRSIVTFAAGGNRSSVTFDLTGCQ